MIAIFFSEDFSRHLCEVCSLHLRVARLRVYFVEPQQDVHPTLLRAAGSILPYPVHPQRGAAASSGGSGITH